MFICVFRPAIIILFFYSNFLAAILETVFFAFYGKFPIRMRISPYSTNDVRMDFFLGFVSEMESRLVVNFATFGFLDFCAICDICHMCDIFYICVILYFCDICVIFYFCDIYDIIDFCDSWRPFATVCNHLRPFANICDCSRADR